MRFSLLRTLIQEVLENDLSNVRIPNQLLSPTGNDDPEQAEASRTREPIRGQEEDGDEVKEFSAAGGGAIAGFSGPLGSAKKRK